ncbi:DUF6247 family protein [Pseudonocardia sp. DLS-67]
MSAPEIALVLRRARMVLSSPQRPFTGGRRRTRWVRVPQNARRRFGASGVAADTLMDVTAVNPFDASPVPDLPPETTPAAIRDALIDEERAEFERAYREAIDEAAQTMDLTRVLDVLRNYHRIAWLTQRQGVAAHRRMLDRAAAILQAGSNPDGIPAEDVRARGRKRLGE